ncbi:MAG: 2-hydroxyglutaryl-CoA dehydratase [Dictyoglomi bacterium]|nr:2-hydroxyglutaryl-CoA dehydratase [Dictyoglomota bacterium]
MKYLGVDVGSVSTDIAVIDEKGNLVVGLYLRTGGDPIRAVKDGFSKIKAQFGDELEIEGVGVTGSARFLVGAVVGADVIKNEITAHATAGLHYNSDIQTIIEIGGQDSKIIIIRDGIVVDFAMNSVCAAGTGSFLDHQAQRLGISIEDFGDIALRSTNPVRIAGRCTVFAESDMIHKQQLGHRQEDILFGLCEALVRNYLSNVGRGKEIRPPILFQGGVAANKGIKVALERALGVEIIIPPYFSLMGAIGAALLAQEYGIKRTKFKGFETADQNITTRGFECKGCSNLCEITNVLIEGKLIARLGGRCGKWENLSEEDLSLTIDS